uniref:Ankyrin UPA domain-containing protein n=1 Tax=Periophthalmus magnuspinnatus TaxID=409849 RepID=A0A3B4ABT1_9GOBI
MPFKYYNCCFGNLVPLTKSGQHHLFSFFAFKENRLALFIKIRDNTQEPCGRLSFLKEPRNYRSLTQNAICNLNITLPSYSKVNEETVLKSELMREPDLLSDVSEMKQDLIKMTAILTADSTGKSPSLRPCGLEKGAEEVSGEPLDIMEKDLERVKEDLEKVSEILRSGTYEGDATEAGAGKVTRTSEEWVLLSDSEIAEAKKMAALDIQEPVLRESRANRGALRPKAIKDCGDLKEYLLDAPVSSKVKAKRESASQEKFTDVVLHKSTPTKVQDANKSADIKKPLRKKGKEDGTDQLSVPIAPSQTSPVSPVVEETPIGSIKDKVKALQQKVEAEQKSKKTAGVKTQLPVSKPSPKAKESPKTKRGPPKSPKAEDEKVEETMSVKEPSSPESGSSVNKHRPLSPDSPIPEFGQDWPDSVLALAGERPTSHKSVCSEVEFSTNSPLLQDSDRPLSPSSVDSGDESMTPQFITCHEMSFTEHIVSSDTQITEFLSAHENSAELLPSHTSIVNVSDSNLTSESNTDFIMDMDHAFTDDAQQSDTMPSEHLRKEDESKNLEESSVVLTHSDPCASLSAGETTTLKEIAEKLSHEEGLSEEKLESQKKHGVHLNAFEFQMDGKPVAETDWPFSQMHDQSLAGEQVSFVESHTERPLSPESDTEFRAFSPETLKSMSLLRSDSQGSVDSFDNYNPLSPDSPIPCFDNTITISSFCVRT